MPECCKILVQMLDLPENASLNEEIEKIVEVVKSTSNSNEKNFQKQLFTSLTDQQQYELLLKVTQTKCEDQSNYCQLMLLIMKKFPNRINEHALKLVEMINRDRNREHQTAYSKDCRLLVFEVFPLILSEQSNLQLSTEQVEKLLENLFEIYFQQSSIGKVGDDETLQIDCHTTLNQMQAKLREIFNLIRVKMNWDPFCIPEQLTLEGVQQQYDQLMKLYKKYPPVYSSTVGQPVDVQKQVFYTSFMLFLVYLDNYIRLTVSKLIVVQRGSAQAAAKNLNAKKRKLNELKNAPVCAGDELSIRLQTAFSGTNQIFAFLNQDHMLQQELFRMIELIGLAKCKSYEIFIIDTYFYKGDNESLLSYFTDRSAYSLKSCVQLVNSSLMTSNYQLTLEYTVKLVHMIADHPAFQTPSADQPQRPSASGPCKIKAENDKCQLTFVNYNKSDILSYAIDVILSSLDKLVLAASHPSDLGIGHVIVLSQYRWPSNIRFFIKCLNLIKSNFANSKFSYPSFMQYILNTDVLEEFRALASADNCKIELAILKPAETLKVKTMTTRGVNKNVKEEIKNALINQMRSSSIRIDDDRFIEFITNELKDFNVKKASSRR